LHAGKGKRVLRADVVNMRCAAPAFGGGFGASAAGRVAAPAAVPQSSEGDIRAMSFNRATARAHQAPSPPGGLGASTATPAGGGFTGVFRDSTPQKADIYEGALMCIHAHVHAHAHAHAHACSCTLTCTTWHVWQPYSKDASCWPVPCQSMHSR
jgi:hypothetical protein